MPPRGAAAAALVAFHCAGVDAQGCQAHSECSQGEYCAQGPANQDNECKACSEGCKGADVTPDHGKRPLGVLCNTYTCDDGGACCDVNGTTGVMPGWPQCDCASASCVACPPPNPPSASPTKAPSAAPAPTSFPSRAPLTETECFITIDDCWDAIWYNDVELARGQLDGGDCNCATGPGSGTRGDCGNGVVLTVPRWDQANFPNYPNNQLPEYNKAGLYDGNKYAARVRFEPVPGAVLAVAGFDSGGASHRKRGEREWGHGLMMFCRSPDPGWHFGLIDGRGKVVASETEVQGWTTNAFDDSGWAVPDMYGLNDAVNRMYSPTAEGVWLGGTDRNYFRFSGSAATQAPVVPPTGAPVPSATRPPVPAGECAGGSVPDGTPCDNGARGCEAPGFCRNDVCVFAKDYNPISGSWNGVSHCPAQPQWIQCAKKDFPCGCSTKVRYGSDNGWSEMNMSNGMTLIDCRDDKFPDGHAGGTTGKVCQCWRECTDEQRWAKDGVGCAYGGVDYSGACASGVCAPTSCVNDTTKCADMGNDCCASMEPGAGADAPQCSDGYQVVRNTAVCHDIYEVYACVLGWSGGCATAGGAATAGPATAAGPPSSTQPPAAPLAPGATAPPIAAGAATPPSQAPAGAGADAAPTQVPVTPPSRTPTRPGDTFAPSAAPTSAAPAPAAADPTGAPGPSAPQTRGPTAPGGTFAPSSPPVTATRAPTPPGGTFAPSSPPTSAAPAAPANAGGAPPQSPNDDGGGLGSGAIAGIVIGCLVGVGLIGAAVFMFLKKSAAAKRTSSFGNVSDQNLTEGMAPTADAMGPGAADQAPCL